MVKVQEYGNGLLVTVGERSLEVPPLEYQAFWDAMNIFEMERWSTELEARIKSLEVECDDLRTENNELVDQINIENQELRGKVAELELLCSKLENEEEA